MTMMVMMMISVIKRCHRLCFDTHDSTAQYSFIFHSVYQTIQTVGNPISKTIQYKIYILLWQHLGSGTVCHLI